MSAVKRGLTGALLLALAVGVPVALVVFQPSPGPLSAAHTGLSALEGRVGCAGCHALSGLQEGCLGCHQEIAAQLGEGRGYHQHLAQSSGATCADCHSEHRGAAFAPLNDASWPDRDPEAFRHEHLEAFALAEGRHGDVADACGACHRPENVAARPHPDHPLLQVPQTFLGLDPDCRRCHTDPHQARLGPDCASCHGQHAWRESTFQHDGWFPLEGRHAQAACSKCHPPTPATPLSAAAGTACADCHQDPHAARPRQRPFAQAGACDRCHTAESFAAPAVTYAPADHCPGRFPLAGRHAEIACAACHTGATGEAAGAAQAADVAPPSAFPARLPQRLDGLRQDRCVACHANVHQRGAGGAPTLAKADRCAECHEATAWRGTKLTAASHGRTGFDLLGPHQQVECARCHSGAQGGDWSLAASLPARAAQAAPTDCAACHDTPHRTSLGRAARSCVSCHASTHRRWSEATVTPARHAAVGFPLTPPHADVACARCHPADQPYAQRYRQVAASDCAGCHRDPHLGQFVSDDRRAAPLACTTCHARTRFRPPTYDLAAHEAAFPLRGAHRAVSCDRCHPQGERPAPDGGTATCRLFRGRPTACSGCHQDPHQGQFAHLGACTACHSGDAAAWEVVAFDHAHTRFPLVGRHAQAKCDACHEAGARGQRRYRALDTRCAACHEDPHAGQFAFGRSPSAGRCDTCHRPDGADWTLAGFDHDRAAFALDGAHDRLACAACHRPYKLRDGRVVVRYRPLGTSCKDCHGSTAKPR